MINCIIVDDEPLAIKLIASYVENMATLNCLQTFTNPLTAIQFIRANKVDLVFLDIQMPELSGVDVARIIDDEVKVIFTTAFPNFAIEGFELNAVDYLVKPVSFSRFVTSVDRVIDTAKVTGQATESKDYIFVKTEYRLQKVDTKDVFYLKGSGDYCTIHLSDEKIMTLEKLKSFAERLSPSKFSRVHKSYIVAIDKINYIEKNRIYIQDEVIPIGSTYEEKFRRLLL